MLAVERYFFFGEKVGFSTGKYDTTLRNTIVPESQEMLS